MASLMRRLHSKQVMIARLVYNNVAEGSSVRPRQMGGSVKGRFHVDWGSSLNKPTVRRRGEKGDSIRRSATLKKSVAHLDTWLIPVETL